MKYPNFFIVGAPKSGTTAMAAYLGQHENIFFSSPKEPCFFSEDFPGHRQTKSIEDYKRLFNDAGDEHIAVGEGSVWYLYSSVALKNIREFNKESKIIVMLRNPCEQVYSMHQECYLWRYEDEPDFEQAWALIEPRSEGKNVPKHCRAPEFLQYRKIASYTFQLKRLFEIFPREQIKVIIYDDFKENNARVYADILKFLGVPSDGRDSFVPVNENRRYRFHWLGGFLLNQPEWLKWFKTKFKKMFGIKRLGVRDFVGKKNTVYEKRKPLDPEMVKKLKEEFREEIDNLSEFIGRDLRSWYE